MKRKIVFFIESLNLGGAEKSLVTLLKNLDETKYEIDLLTITENGFFKDELPSWVSYKKVNQKKISLFQRIKFFLINQKSDKVYDIAIAYGQGFPTYYVAEKIDANKKFAWINIDYKKAGYNINFDKSYYNKFDEIVMVSPEVQAGFIEECRELHLEYKTRVIKDISDKIEILKNADRKLQKELKGKIKILTVGRLAGQKGLTLAIQACKILNDKKYNLNWYVLGEGAQRNELEKLIKENNLENRFYLLGADPNPYPYIKNCDIYVQSSLFEGLGLTVIEAAILHKPIVCTNFPTAYSILKDGETGLIVEMDSEAIAAGIEKLINKKDLKEKIVSNLKKLKNSDKEITLKKFEELIGGNE